MDLKLRVTPNAAANKIIEEIDEQGTVLYRVYVTVPPEDGKANAAVLKLLGKHLGVAKSSLTVIRGETSRDKIVRLDNG